MVRYTFDNFITHIPLTHILMHTLTSHSHMAHPHTEDEGNLIPTDISCLELPCPTPSPDHSPEPERAVVSMERAWP